MECDAVHAVKNLEVSSFGLKSTSILTTLSTSRTLLGSDSLWVTEIYAIWKKPADSVFKK